MLDVEVLRDADGVFVDPRGERLVADTLLLERGVRERVGELTLVLFFGDVFADEAPVRVRTAGVLDGGVHINRKRIADPTDLNILVKTVIVAVLRQQSDVAFAISDLVFTRGVVRNISV